MPSENPPPARSNPGVDATLKRHGGLSYLEIPATNLDASERFYRAVLGWNIQGGKFSDNANFLIGRFITSRPPPQNPGMIPYFYVDNIRQSFQSALAAGGREIKPIYAEADLWVAVIQDPAGNTLGLWEEAHP